MKLTLDKKRIKDLSQNKQELSGAQTPNVAGGCNSGWTNCFGNTLACCSQGTCYSRYCQ
ncbi:hypothetical protein [Pseudoalteromonas luteoviolacea]|uniref:Uncharacterized protein n=1 Tax=Pseudoalteromonas luteoviolacea S4054 TaxID=1129367 RepID=A0A0F6AIX4_9GAMM|nr:hypothetical protein [Pseudoalteromonas luteoviolacea]KKE85904.1 hypothetical protein N479_00590 [Pseudoalteromonas luteoviolacea S4054]KZN74782.1 hypothetical protein N481_08970 [Pseudoalteromonas luteoviolacea S4047-1]